MNPFPSKIISREKELASKLDTRMQMLAKRFTGNIEIGGYLIGDQPDAITKLVLPKNIMGVDTGLTGKFKLERFIDTSGSTKVMIGVNRDTNKLGLQVVMTRDGVDQDQSQFLPIQILIMDKLLSGYISDKMVDQLFPRITRDQISNDFLVNTIKSSNNTLSHTYFDNGEPDTSVDFLADSLNVDMFAGRRSLHPTNDFTTDSLRDNQFGGKKIYGIPHVHFGFTEQETEGSYMLRELTLFDDKFTRLISPGDASQIISSRPLMKKVSRGEMDMGLGLVGVTALDPINKEILGSSYFDVLALSNPDKAQDLSNFQNLTKIAKADKQDIGAIKEFYSFISEYSPAELPGYVQSI